MNIAEWILVSVLSITLFIFLIVGIILVIKLIDLTKEVKAIVVEGQDIAKNTNGIVSNVKGMTSIGGTVEAFIDKYITPKLKEKAKEKNKAEKEGEKDGRKTGEK